MVATGGAPERADAWLAPKLKLPLRVGSRHWIADPARNQV